MDRSSELFRNEALAARARPAATGSELALGTTWATRAFWPLLVLVALALVAGIQIRVEQRVRGLAAVEGDRVVVVVPAAPAGEVAPGTRVLVGGKGAAVVSGGERVLDPSFVQATYGIEVSVPSLALLTDADGAGRSASVVTSKPLLVAIVPGLDGILGDD